MAPDVEEAAQKVEEALKAADQDALLNLIHPSQQKTLEKADLMPVELMPQMGESFAARRMIERNTHLVLYEVSFDDQDFFVEFILFDGQWWLWMP